MGRRGDVGMKKEGIERSILFVFLALFLRGRVSPETCIYVPTSPRLPG